MFDTGRREFITFLGGAAAWPLAARAQRLRVAQIGVLVLTNADGQSLTRELRLGLRDLGYSEGQNFAFQLRSADGDAARLPHLATELVRSQVDVGAAPSSICSQQAQYLLLPAKNWGSKQIDEGLLEYGYLTTHQSGAQHAPYAFVSGFLFSRDIRRIYRSLELPVCSASRTLLKCCPLSPSLTPIRC